MGSREPTAPPLETALPVFIARRIKDSMPLRSTIGITAEMMTFLISLRFLMFAAYSCIYEHETIMSDLLTHAEDVAYTAAHLSFLSLDPECMVHSEFSKLLETLNPVRPELRQMYRVSLSSKKIWCIWALSLKICMKNSRTSQNVLIKRSLIVQSISFSSLSEIILFGIIGFLKTLACRFPTHSVEKTYTHLIEPSLLANTQTENEEMVLFQDVMEKMKKKLLLGGRYLNTYSWRELLLTLLNDVEPSDHTKKADDQLAKELRQVLLTKRFLILIDDVWDTKAWDYLHMCFQGIKNGSRIILTTRLSDVAHYAKCESNPHDLPLLRDDESWKLLQKKVSHGDNCPSELGDVGFRIAKSCGGLPLFIVLVAGVLKEKNNKADLWKEVEESLDALNIDSLEESMSIIGFSYMNLPHHLKPCFLYFGGFSRGKSIHVSKLNPIMVGRRDNDVDAHIYPDKPEDYRLTIHFCQDEFAEWRPHRSSIHSLLFNATSDDQYTTMAHDISFILNSFKLVKYFAARTGVDSIPSSIANLWNLATFIIKGMRGQEILRNMPNLTKLKCLVGFSRKWRGECVLIPRLDFLSRLESLNLFSNNCPIECLRGFNFPSELRELTLSNLCLPWRKISIVGTLCNLEVLKLLNKAFEGIQWNVNVTEFPELKYLKLDNLDFAQWSISEDSFPSLERLVLTNSEEIQTTQREDMANDAFTVTIQPPDWDRRSSP
uniref:Putative disease resistance protein n=1 Tax=Solanum demissum TaxID=50514 RepID=Q6L4J9_SOLDE|nr:putative disease resistance protein [Solanum demissum]